jgi:hypothetical protein
MMERELNLSPYHMLKRVGYVDVFDTHQYSMHSAL